MKRTIAILLFVNLIGATLFANKTFNVQGILRDSNGKAVPDGTYQITFAVYESTTGGSSLWSETHDNVQTINGVYTVELGSIIALDLPFTTKYYLGITVESDAEMTPRLPLSSFTTAIMGEDNVFPGTGQVEIGFESGTNLTGTGAYGGLHLKQKGGNDSFVGITADATASYGGTQGGILFQGSSSYGTKIHFLTTNSYTAGMKQRMTLDHRGYLGIGTDSPAKLLDVNGETRLNNYWNFENTNELNTDGKMYLNYGNSHDVIIAHGGGKVGIGTNNPVRTLDVRGGILNQYGGSYDVWIQGGTTTSGGDARNLALLGVSSNDKLYVNYNREYGGGTAIGGPVYIYTDASISQPDMQKIYDGNGELRLSLVRLTSPDTWALLFYGSSWSWGWWTWSDARMERNIEQYSSENAFEAVKSLNIRRYEFLPEGSRIKTGLIAQEVEAVLPEAVTTLGEEFQLPDGTKIKNVKSINYDRITLEMLAAMQELIRENETLKAEVNDLKRRVYALEQ